MEFNQVQENELKNLRGLMNEKELTDADHYFELRKYDSPIGPFLYNSLKEFLIKNGVPVP
jgi:hypothetical protein